MGAQLLKYYDLAKELGGFKAQMRMAVITNLPSPAAQSAADSQQNIDKFEFAVKEIRKEFDGRTL